MSSEVYETFNQEESPPLKRKAWKTFSDYASRTSIHGIQYLGDVEGHWFEKVFWMIVFVISFSGCSFLIKETYDKWIESPVIVSFEERSTPVWKIPFPAVTICSETKAQTDLVNISKLFAEIRMCHNDPTQKCKNPNITVDDIKKLEALYQVCDYHFEPTRFRLTSAAKLSGKDCLKQLEELTVPQDEIFTACRWRGEKMDDCQKFTKVITEEGICYTFNMLDYRDIYKDEEIDDSMKNPDHGVRSNQWSLDSGYKTTKTDLYPQRVLGSGLKSSLAIQLSLKKSNLEYSCKTGVQGFRITLHRPGEIPRTSKEYFNVPFNHQTIIGVKPRMIITSEELLKDYAPSGRQCYHHERQLKYFKVYTQSNCELECLTEFVLRECKCVKFSMPHENGTKICAYDEVSCYYKAESVWLLEELNNSIEKNSTNHHFCNCLPSCTSLEYDAEISQADFNSTEYFKAAGIDTNHYQEVDASVHIYFKDDHFISTKRSQLYGLTDFLANCGGLLGLFMGFSILSMVEIFYHFTLRFACRP
ncbi:unnamed protein product [Diamesa tonsa]